MKVFIGYEFSLDSSIRTRQIDRYNEVKHILEDNGISIQSRNVDGYIHSFTGEFLSLESMSLSWVDLLILANPNWKNGLPLGGDCSIFKKTFSGQIYLG